MGLGCSCASYAGVPALAPPRSALPAARASHAQRPAPPPARPAALARSRTHPPTPQCRSARRNTAQRLTLSCPPPRAHALPRACCRHSTVPPVGRGWSNGCRLFLAPARLRRETEAGNRRNPARTRTSARAAWRTCSVGVKPVCVHGRLRGMHLPRPRTHSQLERHSDRHRDRGSERDCVRLAYMRVCMQQERPSLSRKPSGHRCRSIPHTSISSPPPPTAL